MTDSTRIRPRSLSDAPHSMQIAWRCVEEARKTLGDGWDHVSDEVRWGLVAARILSVVVGQHALENEKATEAEVANVARYAHELWVEGFEIRDSGWKRPWGKLS